MSVLVIAEHDNKNLKSSTLNTISAAEKLSEDIHLLILGNKIEDLANEISAYLNTPGRKIQSLSDSSKETWIKLYKPNPIRKFLRPMVHHQSFIYFIYYTVFLSFFS